MKKKINLGFVGAGNIYSKHYQAVNKLKNIKILSIADPKNIEKSKSINFYKAANIMLKKEKKLDIVSILTPSGRHYKDIVDSLKYKKNIIVEKPICLKISDLNKILNLNKKYKKEIFVVFQQRLNKYILELKKIIKKRELGNIFLVSSKLYWSRNKNYYSKSKWRGSWKFDGGVVSNQGIHNLDLMIWLFGDIKSVYAIGKNFYKFQECEDTAIITITFKTGVLCSMEFTTNCVPNNLENSLTVLGSKGYVKITGKNLDDKFLTNLNFKNLEKAENMSLHAKFYYKVLDTLLYKKKNEFSAESAKSSLELLTAIYKSIELNKEIKIPLRKNTITKLGY